MQVNCRAPRLWIGHFGSTVVRNVLATDAQIASSLGRSLMALEYST